LFSAPWKVPEPLQLSLAIAGRLMEHPPVTVTTAIKEGSAENQGYGFSPLNSGEQDDQVI
jgi:hypothetical protein